MRLALVTASALRLPALTLETALTTAGELRLIWLPWMSLIICEIPLYGAWTMSIPVFDFSSTNERWVTQPFVLIDLGS